jgi:hypothetical protein
MDLRLDLFLLILKSSMHLRTRWRELRIGLGRRFESGLSLLRGRFDDSVILSGLRIRLLWVVSCRIDLRE